ncbi:MAG: hypothetical protein JO097_13755 [Acidobacteriaceae bacterium]|nr:hypothetical protein [Acidobacteriaceae bacterium]MBV9767399.1 hypothetical protein [Acidobacteriaceae bacterium]
MQVFYGSIPLIAAILLTSWKDSKRVEDLKTSVNKRIDDLHMIMATGFKDVKEHLGRLEDRISELEKGSRLIRS